VTAGITELVETGSASTVVESGVAVSGRTARSLYKHVVSTDSMMGMGVCSEARFAFSSNTSDSTAGAVSEMGRDGVVFSTVVSGAT